MNQVKENQVEQVYRRNKVIEGIMMFFQALSVNEGANQTEEEKEAERIRVNYQDNDFTDGLEKNTGTADISLENTDEERTAFVQHKNVSEEAAKKKADEVKKQKEDKTRGNDFQK